jgi:hypothetical protein
MCAPETVELDVCPSDVKVPKPWVALTVATVVRAEMSGSSPIATLRHFWRSVITRTALLATAFMARAKTFMASAVK